MVINAKSIFIHKTVLFQTIQFSVIKQFCSIWPNDKTLSGATTQVRVDLGTTAMKEYSAFPNAPALLKPHHQIV